MTSLKLVFRYLWINVLSFVFAVTIVGCSKEETSELKNKVKDATDETQELVDEAMEKTKDMANDAANEIEDLCEQAKEKVDAKDTDC
ncbi:MAG: YtxH domain-containing protein [Gammaproteobacteria bacterium]|nr:YtxH domain-containing protein [Gammaproteobacteria bacterium]